MQVCIPAFSQEVITWGSNLEAPPTQGLIAISSGDTHVLGLKADGTVIAWGDNSYGQTNVPADLNNVIAISAGAYHSAALKADGTVVAWGRNSHGQCNIPPALSNVIQVTVGDWHTVALKGDGTVVAWGDNTFNQLNIPSSITDVTALSAGGFHTLALKADGTVVAWGMNSYGQTDVPEGLSDVIKVSAGYRHSMALRANGTVTAWGNNDSGQINVPIGLQEVASIDAGPLHNIALRVDGSAVVWGNNDHGQTLPPDNLTNICEVVAGFSWSIALKKTNLRVRLWGSNTQLQSEEQHALNNVRAVAGGAQHSMALLSDGTITSWGSNLEGQTSSQTVFKVKAIDAGEAHSVAVLFNGTVTAWGRNAENQTVVPPGLSGVANIAAGAVHTVALKANGSLVGWGSNNYGQLSMPSEAVNIKLIKTGLGHALALRADGIVLAWGANDFGQTTVPLSLSNVRSIAAGENHSLALRSDGTVVAWGDNTYGQLNIPPGLAGVKSIDAGSRHSVAVLADGSVKVWGDNTFGQKDLPVNLNSVLSVSAGKNHTICIVHNQPPLITGNSASLMYLEDAGNVFVEASLSGADPDDQTVTSATIKISDAVEGDILHATTAVPFSADYDQNTSTLSIAGKGTMAEYLAMLRSVTYHSVNAAPGVKPTRGISLTLFDGIDSSNTFTKTLLINPVNDAPSFVKGNDIIVNEDVALQTFTAWATSISAGPADEQSQLLLFELTSDNDHLFEVLPALDVAGNLTFKPSPNVFGTATVTIKLHDDGDILNNGVNASENVTFMITIQPVNDKPYFFSGENIVVDEDAGEQTFNLWASSVSTGPENESSQSWHFELETDNADLFEMLPSIDPNGTLSFSLVPNFHGKARVKVVLVDGGGTDNGGIDKHEEEFLITVNSVNDIPRFTMGEDVSVLEDSPLYTAQWATSISAGPNETEQKISFLISTTNPTLFSVLPSVTEEGILSFVVAADAYGTSIVQVILKDDGGILYEGKDQTPVQEFRILVEPINDIPSLTTITDTTISINTRAFQVKVNAIHAGANEAHQELRFETIIGNPELIQNVDVIYDGTSQGILVITPYQEVIGESTVEIILHDNGGTENNGIDAYVHVFKVTVEDQVQQIFIPNLFSPNGDGSNDVFRVRGAGIASIDLTIYNSRGIQVFNTQDVGTATQTGWDGTYQGNQQPSGSYRWVLKGKYINGEPLTSSQNQYGKFILLR